MSTINTKNGLGLYTWRFRGLAYNNEGFEKPLIETSI
jgi:hypothetical protein